MLQKMVRTVLLIRVKRIRNYKKMGLVIPVNYTPIFRLTESIVKVTHATRGRCCKRMVIVRTVNPIPELKTMEKHADQMRVIDCTFWRYYWKLMHRS